MVKILGICGSLCKGVIEYVVLEVLKEVEIIFGIEIEYWLVRGKKISFCVYCDVCIRKEIMCIIKDDI